MEVRSNKLIFNCTNIMLKHLQARFGDNEPLIDETKLDYYAKHLKNNVPITQQIY